MKLPLVLPLLWLPANGFQSSAFPASTIRQPRGGRTAVSPTKSPFQRQGNICAPTTKTTTLLQSSPLVDLVSSPVGALGVLASIIVIHEAGHYLAARSFGIAVEEFAVGIGPKLFGFNAFGNEFNIRAIPLGGYVRFPENYNATEYNERQQEAYDKALAKKNNPVEANPTLGYRLANFVTFGSLDRQSKKAKQEEKEQILEEYEKLPWWGKLKAIRNKQDEYEKVEVEPIEIQYDDNSALLQNRPWQERAVVISGGVIFNLLLSFSIYFGQIAGPAGLPSPIFDPGVKVGSINNNMAAATGVLRPGDVIYSANGMSLTKSTQPSISEAQKGMNDLIAAIRATPDGGEVQLEVKHESAKGDWMETVNIRPKRNSNVPGSTGPQSIGVMLTPNYVAKGVLKTSNPIEAARLAALYTCQLTAQTASGLGQALKQMVVGSSGGSGSAVSGPIGLIRTGSEVVATKDLQTVLLFAAAISVNLGVINAFPLPALDGGQLVFVLAEALTRRKVNQQFQESVTSFAVLLLLLVSVSAAFGDISSIFAR